MKWRVIFICLLGISNLEAQTLQTETDSLVKALDKTSNDSTKARIYRNLSAIYQFENPEKALDYAQRGLAIVKKMNWEKGLTLFNIDIGSYHNNSGNHALAIEHYLNALETIESLPDETPNIYSNISIAYEKEDNTTMAEKYAQMALAIHLQAKDSFYISNSYDRLGFIQYRKKDFMKAARFYNQALELNPDPENTLGATILSHLGDIEINAIKKRAFYLRSQAIWDKEDPEFLIAVSNAMSLAEGDIELLKNDSLLKNSGIRSSKTELADEAKKLLQKSIQISKFSKIRQNLMYAYGLLSDLYAIEKMHDSAYFYLKENLLLNDSIFSQESKNKIAQLESQKELALRDKAIQINELKLSAKERQKWFFILGIGLLAIIGGLLFYQSSNRKKTNQKLQLLNSDLDQANKTKARFFSILNHDLRAPVANLIHFLHLQKDSPELLDKETKNKMQAKTISGAENLLSSMEDILLWSKGQMVNFKPRPKTVSVGHLFQDLQNHFYSEEKVTIVFENPNGLELHTDEDYLKTIMRNLTGNAIKAFEHIIPGIANRNPSIVWKAWQENNRTFLEITDNGIGATQEQFKALYVDNEVIGTKSGLGLHLIRDMAKAINCEISVASEIDHGTTFLLKF